MTRTAKTIWAALLALPLLGLPAAAQPPAQHVVAEFGPPTQITIPPIERQPSGPTVQAVEGDEAYDYSVSLVKAPLAHAKGLTGKGVILGVGDTGLDSSHPEFQGRVKAEKDFTGSRVGPRDVQNHGTHCTGAAAAAKNGSGTIGVAPECTILNAKVLGDNGSGGSDGIRAGVLWMIAQGADVVSLSLGGGGRDRYQEDMLEQAEKAGVIVVIASGNDGARDGISYPALYPTAISTGAIDGQFRRASFSNGGKTLWWTLPGVNTRSTLPGGRYGPMSGTSMATPVGAGVAALWCQANPTIPKSQRPAKFREWVAKASRDLPPPGRDLATGYGCPDATTLLSTDPTPEPPGVIEIGDADLTAVGRGKFPASGATKVEAKVTVSPVAIPSPMPGTPVAPKPPTDDERYAAFLASLTPREVNTRSMAIGVDGFVNERFPHGFKGIPDGTYVCYLADGKPCMQAIGDAPMPTRVLTSPPIVTYSQSCPGGVCGQSAPRVVYSVPFSSCPNGQCGRQPFFGK